MTQDRELTLDLPDASVGAHLAVPTEPHGLIVFAHGSGSSRHSPRNRFVAEVLQQDGFATLLVDLLTPDEACDRAAVFDIDLLARRVRDVIGWAREQPELEALPVGVFGASTGAAAALAAAADSSSEVVAVVSRGGRPDLARAHLRHVRAPTLLIVGGLDTVVIELNEQARSRLRCECELRVVPGASHLFEEPGTLEAAARLASEWFLRHRTS